MNSKWLKRVVSAAGIAGGLLFFGAGAANAAIPVANDNFAPQHIVQGGSGLVQPVGLQHLGDRFQPLGSAPRSESGMDGVAGALGNPPTNGMKVDVPQLANAAGQQVNTQAAPVTQQVAQPVNRTLGSLPEDGAVPPLSTAGGTLGNLAGGLTSGTNPLGGLANGNSGVTNDGSGMTNDGAAPEARALALPLSATSRVLPLSVPEDFTVAKGSQLPVSGLGDDVRTLGDTVNRTVDQRSSLPAGSIPTAPNQAPESALPAADGLAGGANVAGIPVANLSGPVLDGLSQQAPEDGTTLALPGPGSDPVGAATGVVGNLADGEGLPGSLHQ
jgi:hypothetical protein